MDNNNQLTSLLIGSYSYLDKTNLMRENKKTLDNNIIHQIIIIVLIDN